MGRRFGVMRSGDFLHALFVTRRPQWEWLRLLRRVVGPNHAEAAGMNGDMTRQNRPTDTAAVLGAIQQAGEAVLGLTHGLAEVELLASGTKRGEVARQLGLLATALRHLPRDAMRSMPEIDWAGWRGMASSLDQLGGLARDEALWFGAHSLVPATLSTLQQYRATRPELFNYWN